MIQHEDTEARIVIIKGLEKVGGGEGRWKIQLDKLNKQCGFQELSENMVAIVNNEYVDEHKR